MEENTFLYEKIEDSKHISLTRSIRHSSGLDPGGGEKVYSLQPQVDRRGETPSAPILGKHLLTRLGPHHSPAGSRALSSLSTVRVLGTWQGGGGETSLLRGLVLQARGVWAECGSATSAGVQTAVSHPAHRGLCKPRELGQPPAVSRARPKEQGKGCRPTCRGCKSQGWVWEACAPSWARAARSSRSPIGLRHQDPEQQGAGQGQRHLQTWVEV